MKIYDPQPLKNEYLTHIYFARLRSLHGIETIDNLSSANGETILLNGEHLDPATIVALKDRGNRIVSFDINDHTSLTQAYRDAPEAALIDVIFKLAGVAKVNSASEIEIDADFNFRSVATPLMSEEQWEVYRQLNIHSLPYVPWQTEPVMPAPSTKSGKILIGGALQFQRTLLAFRLLRHNQMDPGSKFHAYMYFHRQMTPSMRLCEDCMATHEREGRYPYRAPQRKPEGCTSPANWGNELDLSGGGAWNNRCPASFFWLAEQYSARYGPVPMERLEQMANGGYYLTPEWIATIAKASGYADLKWRASIFAPPRFWEAAAAGTVNIVPSRTNEQRYFPEINDGEHYVSFDEADQGPIPLPGEQEMADIAARTTELYKHWILKPQNLCRHIIDIINN